MKCGRNKYYRRTDLVTEWMFFGIRFVIFAEVNIVNDKNIEGILWIDVVIILIFIICIILSWILNFWFFFFFGL